MKNKLPKTFIITLCVLIIPLIGTFVLEDWNWDAGDFIIAALLLFSFGLLINFLAIKLKNSKYRLPVIIALILLLLWIWAELAVGILF